MQRNRATLITLFKALVSFQEPLLYNKRPTSSICRQEPDRIVHSVGRRQWYTSASFTFSFFIWFHGAGHNKKNEPGPPCCFYGGRRRKPVGEVFGSIVTSDGILKAKMIIEEMAMGLSDLVFRPVVWEGYKKNWKKFICLLS